jgi:hypothetical protein
MSAGTNEFFIPKSYCPRKSKTHYVVSDQSVLVVFARPESENTCATRRSLKTVSGPVHTFYTITLDTSSAVTCSLWYVKLLTGYGGSSSNHTVFTIVY